MRIAVALLGVLVFLGATYGVVKMLNGYQVNQPPPSQSKKVVTDGHDGAGHSHDDGHSHDGEKPKAGGPYRGKKEDYVPPISESGPWPKVGIDQTEFEFGRMEVGEERVYDFVIRNEGDAELEIAKGNTTCQCTISEVENNKIPPGGSAKITLRWRPTAQAERFEKGAEIRTNDPNNKSFTLRILGMVAPRFVLVPSENWEIREVNESTDSATNGALISPILDEFEIEKLVYDEDRMDVKFRKLVGERLQPVNGKSAYSFDVTVRPGMPVGNFRFPLKIFTNTYALKADGTPGEQYILDVFITGRRDGPVKFLGPAYIAERSTVLLGNFSAAEGKSVPLMMLVREAPEEGLKFLEFESDPKFLKVTLDPESKAVGHARRYTARFEVPAGQPRDTRNEDKPATLKIKTNHPAAPDISLKIHFSTY